MHHAKLTITIMTLLSVPAQAHEGHSHTPSPQSQEKIVRLNTEQSKERFVMQRQPAEARPPGLAKLFARFSDSVDVRFTEDYLFVESNGMPAHSMMTGITAWQQQVPLPQSYRGDNAWRIPLHPVPAKNPMSTKEHFFRGAIALAVNGVPIFNPIKNDGKTDTMKAGELDQWGGHCGRADDYHYHIAPVHLEKIVGAGNPVAVALDGYPIYGYNDPNGKPPADLDSLNGHKGPEGNFHYHATKTFPYLNGGFYGEVVEQNGQVDPQPRAQPLRPSLTGLKGARINGFENPKPNSYVLFYDVNGDKRSVNYTVADDGSATFNFVSQQGTTTETHTPRQPGGGGDQGGRNGRPAPEEKRPRRDDQTGIKRAGQRRGGQQGQGGGQHRGGGQRRGGGGGQRGPQPGDGPRQPWILVHADEIDLDHNKIISRDEIVGEATKAFAGYDTNSDGKLSQSELSVRGGSRSAMGGFLKGHSEEIDRDGDGILSRAEAVGNSQRMFEKMDTNGDGNISAEEMQTSRRK